MDTVPTFYLRNVSTPRASRVRRVNKDASNNGKQRGSLVKLLCGKCARVCCVLLLDKHCPTFCTTWVFPNVRPSNGCITAKTGKRLFFSIHPSQRFLAANLDCPLERANFSYLHWSERTLFEKSPDLHSGFCKYADGGWNRDK